MHHAHECTEENLGRFNHHARGKFNTFRRELMTTTKANASPHQKTDGLPNGDTCTRDSPTDNATSPSSSLIATHSSMTPSLDARSFYGHFCDGRFFDGRFFDRHFFDTRFKRIRENLIPDHIYGTLYRYVSSSIYFLHLEYIFNTFCHRSSLCASYCFKPEASKVPKYCSNV